MAALIVDMIPDGIVEFATRYHSFINQLLPNSLLEQSEAKTKMKFCLHALQRKYLGTQKDFDE